MTKTELLLYDSLQSAEVRLRTGSGLLTLAHMTLLVGAAILCLQNARGRPDARERARYVFRLWLWSAAAVGLTFVYGLLVAAGILSRARYKLTRKNAHDAETLTRLASAQGTTQPVCLMIPSTAALDASHHPANAGRSNSHLPNFWQLRSPSDLFLLLRTPLPPKQSP